MKLRYRLWIVFSLLWLAGIGLLHLFIIDMYKDRALAGQQQLVLSQGMTITDRIKGMLPHYPKRAEGYLDYYSDSLSTRLFLLDENGLTLYDSYRQYQEGSRLQLSILTRDSSGPSSMFLHTEAYGHVQHTLLDLGGEVQAGQLLIVTDANGIYEEIREFRRNIVLILSGASLAGFLACYGIATWFTRPIRRIVQHLERITPQNREFGMSYRSKDELGELVARIKLMVQELDSYERRQRQFISASSHELKTPLATMQLITENLPQLYEDKGMLEEYVGDLQQQITKMRLTVQSMLDVYRSAERSLQLTRIPFGAIREHLEETFRSIAKDKGMKVIYEASAESDDIMADRSLLYSGLDNLMFNAILYSPEATTIRVRLISGGEDRTVLQICDEGIGIDPEDLPFIFEPFYRSRRAAAWNEGGSGFGLAMAKQMMELHEGDIEVESTPHKGTCFTLTFRNNGRAL